MLKIGTFAPLCDSWRVVNVNQVSVDRLHAIPGSPRWYYATHPRHANHNLEVYYPSRLDSKIFAVLELCSGREDENVYQLQMVLNKAARKMPDIWTPENFRREYQVESHFDLDGKNKAGKLP